jgi:hypothetical protein
MGQTTDLDMVTAKKKKVCPCYESNSGHNATTHHYADYAISVHTNTIPNYFACATLSELLFGFLTL